MERDPATEALLEQAREMRRKRHRDLAETVAESKVGNGRVRAKVNGHRALVSIRIAPELLVPDRREELEELVTRAFNNALGRIEDKLGDDAGPNMGTLFANSIDPIF